MYALISLIVAASFGIWGYKKKLFPIWAFAFNVIIAVYLGLMLTPVVLHFTLAGEVLKLLGPYANVSVMILIAGGYFALAQFLSSTYLTTTYCISFPRLVDDIGGSLLGFAGGLVIIHFILFAIAISPLKDISAVSKYLPPNTESYVTRTCRFVSGFSLQSDDKNIAKAIEIVGKPPVATPIKTTTDVPSVSVPASTPITPPIQPVETPPIEHPKKDIIQDLNQ